MSEPTAEVAAAADRLMEAFSGGDEDGYFACFAPDATFFFHDLDPILSRQEYRDAVRSWKEEHGFRVLSSVSSDRRIAVYGDTAVLMHRVRTDQVWDGERATLNERESIVFRREPDGSWLAVHEHLSWEATP